MKVGCPQNRRLVVSKQGRSNFVSGVYVPYRSRAGWRSVHTFYTSPYRPCLNAGRRATGFRCFKRTASRHDVAKPCVVASLTNSSSGRWSENLSRGGLSGGGDDDGAPTFLGSRCFD